MITAVLKIHKTMHDEHHKQDIKVFHKKPYFVTKRVFQNFYQYETDQEVLNSDTRFTIRTVINIKEGMEHPLHSK